MAHWGVDGGGRGKTKAPLKESLIGTDFFWDKAREPTKKDPLDRGNNLQKVKGNQKPKSNDPAGKIS